MMESGDSLQVKVQPQMEACPKETEARHRGDPNGWALAMLNAAGLGENGDLSSDQLMGTGEQELG